MMLSAICSGLSGGDVRADADVVADRIGDEGAIVEISAPGVW